MVDDAKSEDDAKKALIEFLRVSLDGRNPTIVLVLDESGTLNIASGFITDERYKHSMLAAACDLNRPFIDNKSLH